MRVERIVQGVVLSVVGVAASCLLSAAVAAAKSTMMPPLSIMGRERSGLIGSQCPPPSAVRKTRWLE